MARPSIDLQAKILSMLDHVGQMPAEAATPLAHYTIGANAATNLRRYLVRQMAKGKRSAVRERHLHVLDNMMLAHLVQAFERFIKDVAAVCVNRLCDQVADDRFDKLSVKGGLFVAHFFRPGSSPGRALCESDTWLSCRQINDRFESFLGCQAGQKKAPPFHVFVPNSDEFRLMSIIWQLRHTLVHNVGVITRSDAAKLRVLARKALPSPSMLEPTWNDVRFLRVYLDQRARDINERVGKRLAVVLTSLHAVNPALFIPQMEADELSAEFAMPLVVAGMTGVVPR